MTATKTEFGFYYEFGEHDGHVHIVRLNQKTKEIHDFFWMHQHSEVEYQIRQLAKNKEMSIYQTIETYFADICLDNIDQWVQVEEEDFHK